VTPLVEESQRNITNIRQRLRYKRKNEVRREFSQKQAVIDIERQLSGSVVPDEDTSEASQMANDMPPEQIRLIEAIPTAWTSEGEWQRRNSAVEAIIAYCNYAEVRRPKRSISRDREDDKQLDSEYTTERKRRTGSHA
jgi:uncharacterized protein DUF3435